MKGGMFLLIGAGLALYLISQQSASAAANNYSTPGVTGGTCPGSPGCPGNMTGYNTDWGVTVSGDSATGAYVGCPGSPGCPGYLGGLSGVWSV